MTDLAGRVYAGLKGGERIEPDKFSDNVVCCGPAAHLTVKFVDLLCVQIEKHRATVAIGGFEIDFAVAADCFGHPLHQKRVKGPAVAAGGKKQGRRLVIAICRSRSVAGVAVVNFAAEFGQLRKNLLPAFFLRYELKVQDRRPRQDAAR